MLISEIMRRNVAECTEDVPLTEVYELIQSSPNGYVVVLESRKHRVPIGIVNEHSICESVVRRLRNAKVLDAGSVLSTNILRVRDDLPVARCNELLNHMVDAVVVVDQRRRLRGAVDPERLTALAGREREMAKKLPIFSGVAAQRIPAAIEIPAFGWPK